MKKTFSLWRILKIEDNLIWTVCNQCRRHFVAQFSARIYIIFHLIYLGKNIRKFAIGERAHNYRRINYVYSLSGPRATPPETVFDTRWGKRREETAIEAAEVEVEEVADGR